MWKPKLNHVLRTKAQWVQHTVVTPAARKSCIDFWKWTYTIIRDLDVEIANYTDDAKVADILDELLFRMLKRALEIAKEERQGMPLLLSTNASQLRNLGTETSKGFLFWKLTRQHVSQSRREIIERYMKR